MTTAARPLALGLLAAGIAAVSTPASATTLRVHGIVSGVETFSPTLEIADAPPLGDLMEFRAFYAANAANDGTTTD